MSTLSSRTTNGRTNNVVALTPVDLSRKLTVGSAWKRIRVGALLSVTSNGNQNVGHGLFYMGLSQGTTAAVGSRLPANFVGACFGGLPELAPVAVGTQSLQGSVNAWTYTLAESGGISDTENNSYFAPATDAYACHVRTLENLRSAYSLPLGAVALPVYLQGSCKRRFPVVLDITRTGAGFRVVMFTPVGGMDLDWRPDQFQRSLRELALDYAVVDGQQMVGLARTLETAAIGGDFDSFNLFWSHPTWQIQVEDTGFFVVQELVDHVDSEAAESADPGFSVGPGEDRFTYSQVLTDYDDYESYPLGEATTVPGVFTAIAPPVYLAPRPVYIGQHNRRLSHIATDGTVSVVDATDCATSGIQGDSVIRTASWFLSGPASVASYDYGGTQTWTSLATPPMIGFGMARSSHAGTDYTLYGGAQGRLYVRSDAGVVTDVDLPSGARTVSLCDVAGTVYLLGGIAPGIDQPGGYASALLRYDHVSGTVTVLNANASGNTDGPLASAQFAYLVALTSDGTDLFMFCNFAVRKLTLSTEVVSTEPVTLPFVPSCAIYATGTAPGEAGFYCADTSNGVWFVPFNSGVWGTPHQYAHVTSGGEIESITTYNNTM